MKSLLLAAVLCVGVPALAKEKEPKLLKGWEVIQIGSYSGKPGYYAKVGNEFQLQVDAVVMNDSVMEDLNKAFSKNPGVQLRTCHALGMHQAIGYTVFKLKDCK